MSLEALPAEPIGRIFALLDTETIKRLRLVSEEICGHANSFLLSKISLGYSTNALDTANAITAHDQIGRCVRSLSFNVAIFPRYRGFHGWESDWQQHNTSPLDGFNLYNMICTDQREMLAGGEESAMRECLDSVFMECPTLDEIILQHAYDVVIVPNVTGIAAPRRIAITSRLRHQEIRPLSAVRIARCGEPPPLAVFLSAAFEADFSPTTLRLEDFTVREVLKDSASTEWNASAELTAFMHEVRNLTWRTAQDWEKTDEYARDDEFSSDDDSRTSRRDQGRNILGIVVLAPSLESLHLDMTKYHQHQEVDFYFTERYSFVWPFLSCITLEHFETSTRHIRLFLLRQASTLKHVDLACGRTSQGLWEKDCFRHIAGELPTLETFSFRGKFHQRQYPQTPHHLYYDFGTTDDAPGREFARQLEYFIINGR